MALRPLRGGLTGWHGAVFSVKVRVTVAIAKVRVGTHAKHEGVDAVAGRRVGLVCPAVSEVDL